MRNSSERFEIAVESESARANLKDIITLDNTCFEDSYWLENVWLGLFNQRGLTVLLTHIDRQAVGFIAYTTVASEAELVRMGVRPEFRNRGIGKSLVASMSQKMILQQIGSVFLEVREDNDNAIQLYQKSGFLEYGRRKNYYRSPKCDALLFHLNLSGVVP